MIHDLLIWLLGSVTLYAIGSNVAWSLGRRGDPTEPWLRRPWPGLARAAFFVGVPALALSLRIPSASDIGLPRQVSDGWSDGGPLAWPWDLLAVLILAILAAGMMVFGRVWRARALGDALSPAWSRLPTAMLFGLAERALLQESHWAFYRACLIASGLASRDLAVFLSLLVLALEAWSSPTLRLAADPVEATERFSQRTILATLSATVFLTTGSSLWAYLAQLIALLLLAASSLDLGDEDPDPVGRQSVRDPSPTVPSGAAPDAHTAVHIAPETRTGPATDVIEPTVV